MEVDPGSQGSKPQGRIMRAVRLPDEDWNLRDSPVLAAGLFQATGRVSMIWGWKSRGAHSIPQVSKVVTFLAVFAG